MSNVVMPKAFADKLNPASSEQKVDLSFMSLRELEGLGITIQDVTHIDVLDLPDVGNGDHVLGVLTDDEAKLFSAYLHVQTEFKKYIKSLQATCMIKYADALREGREEELHGTSMIEEAATERIFRFKWHRDCLKNLFFFTLREKYNCHEYAVSVRSKRRFVKRHKLHIMEVAEDLGIFPGGG